MESEWAMLHSLWTRLFGVVVRRLSVPVVAATWRTLVVKKEAFQSWSAQGSPEAADNYQESRGFAASVVAEAKTRVTLEFGEAVEKDFQLASWKFWQAVMAHSEFSKGVELLTLTEDAVKQ